jgi:hypothetical protein
LPADLVTVEVEGLTFSMTPEVAALARSGELDLDVGYMQGKVKVAGDMARFFDALPLAGWPALRAALQVP